jgi:DNA-binding NtrC family response regulator
LSPGVTVPRMARPKGSPSVLSALQQLAEATIPESYDLPTRMALGALQGQAREALRATIRRAIEAQGGVIERAAEPLGCSVRSLRRWVADDFALRPTTTSHAEP